jgi:hypothetical protein
MGYGARRASGIVLPLFVAGLVGMLGVTGLALDGGHMMLNKTRLQNAVDMAALSAAKTLDQTRGDVVEAEAEATRVLGVNAGLAGNGEIRTALGDGMTVTIQFSNTLRPFVPGTEPAEYVRVRAENMTLPGWFIQTLGWNDKTLGATAVAGPSPTLGEACNIAPVMVCGDTAAGAAGNFGYTPNMPVVLKTASSAGGTWEVGPGNFQLIRLSGPGAAVVREGLAGSYEACVSVDGTMETQPGNSVGPVAQGLNTRLGIYTGPMGGTAPDFPPDVVTQEVSPRLTYDETTRKVSYKGQVINTPADITYFDSADYEARLAAGDYDEAPAPDGRGVFGRRVLAVPVGDCSTTTNGQGTVKVLGMMCYHLLQSAVQKGNEAHVYGEFITTGCNVTGSPGPAPVTGAGPYIIQLYKDPDGNA